MKKLILIALLVHSVAFGQSSEGQLVFTEASFVHHSSSGFSTKGTQHATCGFGYSNVIGVQYSWISVFDNDQVIWSKKIPQTNMYWYNTSVRHLINSEDVVLFIEGTNTITSKHCYSLTRFNYTSGDVVWSKYVQFDDHMMGNYAFLDAVEVNSQDEVIVTISMNDYLYAAKFSPTGDLIFSKKINNIGDGYGKNPGFSFTETSDGGYIGTAKNENNPTLVKFNADLSIAWSKIWSIEVYGQPRTALELSNGKFAIAGVGDQAQRSFIAIMDQNGAVETYKTIQNQAGVYELDYLSEMSENNLFAAGSGFCMTIDMTTGLVTEYNNLNVSQLKLNLSGGVNVFDSYSSTTLNTVSFSTLFNPEESLCNPFQSNSYYSSDVTIAPNQVTNTTFYVVNMGELSNYTLTTEPLTVSLVSGCFLSVDETMSISFDMYPNPVSTDNQLTIQLRTNPLQGQAIQLTDLSGAVIQQVQVENSTIEMTIPKVAAGMYLINYLDQNNNIIASRKLAVN